MPTLNEQIETLQNRILELENKVKDLSKNTESRYQGPYSVSGGGGSDSSAKPSGIRSGKGGISGGPVLWNNTDAFGVYGTEPDEPTIGYNKHTHSRFSGGALISDALEIVEYESGITNKHSQGFLRNAPVIKKAQSSSHASVDMIGPLDLTFNADTGKWTVSCLEIDVKKCNFVEKDESGNIVHSAPLWNEDPTKTSIFWDESGKVWRIYAVYAPGE
jgi:hypothetical protein